LGHTPPDRLFDVLSALREDGIRFVPLGRIVEARAQGRAMPADSAALTIDDGYADLEDAASVFYSLECPATVFVTTGFVDGANWMWWDRIRFCLDERPVGVFSHQLKAGSLRWSWGGEHAGPAHVAAEMARALEFMPPADRDAIVDDLADQLDLELPCTPPMAFRPATWDTIRGLERKGISFAPHTVTHPILSYVDEDAARWEIATSWARLKEELAAPVPYLAYPNGSPGTFSSREARFAREVGIEAAVSTRQWYAVSDHPRVRGDLFRIPRFPFETDAQKLFLLCRGIRRLDPRVRLHSRRASASFR